MVKPELLAPAGGREHLEMAVAYGADAVYLAGASFGMRAAAGRFGGQALYDAVSFCRARGVAVYLACNTLPRGDELDALPALFEEASAAGVSALIITDLGAFSLAKRHAPGIPLHVSTQAGVVNHEAARMWHELGASRVILARELSLEEIAALRAKTPPELELEAFVHGAMCVSFSGRCVLSNYMTGRDANRGACAQPCRYRYALMEEKRPGEYYPVFEDDTGTHLFNSRDLCAIDHLPKLLSAGVTSLKIEGRAKTAYYAAIITNAYRHALDAALRGEALDPLWRGEVDKVSHRPYCTGFLFPEDPATQVTHDSCYLHDWNVVAVGTGRDGEDTLLSMKNRFARGDELELLTPGERPVRFRADDLRGGDGEALDEALHPQMALRMRLPLAAGQYAVLRRENNGSGT